VRGVQFAESEGTRLIAQWTVRTTWRERVAEPFGVQKRSESQLPLSTAQRDEHPSLIFNTYSPRSKRKLHFVALPQNKFCANRLCPQLVVLCLLYFVILAARQRLPKAPAHSALSPPRCARGRYSRRAACRRRCRRWCRHHGRAGPAGREPRRSPFCAKPAA